jgi:hypothetical protein
LAKAGGGVEPNKTKAKKPGPLPIYCLYAVEEKVELTLKKAAVEPPSTAPYLIFCWRARSSADSALKRINSKMFKCKKKLYRSSSFITLLYESVREERKEESMKENSEEENNGYGSSLNETSTDQLGNGAQQDCRI